MEFDHNKYFSNALKRIVSHELKKLEFSKRGTLSFIRRTENNVIQVINFQKSKWGNKGFYINAGNITLYKRIDSFLPEVGYRLNQFDNIHDTKFNFQIPIIGDLSLKYALEVILKKVIPYLDYTNSLENIHSFAQYSTKNLERYPFLKDFAYLDKPNESLAYRFLCLKEYSTARQIYDSIEHRKFNPETKEWKYYRPTKYDPIINQIDNKEFDVVEKEIKENIQYSLAKCKFDKLKPTQTPEISIEELISKLGEESIIPERRSTFPSYHYKVYSQLDITEIFRELKAIIDKKHQTKQRENELIIELNSGYSFYLSINASEYVIDESVKIVSEYSGTKNIDWIKSQGKRIEFWSDEDKNVEFFNEHLFLIESWKNLDIEILHGDKILFFDEN